MLRYLVVLAAVAFPGAAAFDEATARGFLEPLWNQTDADGSGTLSLSELRKAMMLLDIPETVFTQHNGSLADFFRAYDDDPADSELSIEELGDAVSVYQDVFLAALMNGAGSVPTGIPEVPAAVTSAKARVSFVVVTAGAPGDIFRGQRRQIRIYFANQSGVPVNQTLMTYVSNTPSGLPASSTSRRLQAAETRITATVFVADDAAAAAARAAVPATSTDLGAVPAFNGLTVTSVTADSSFEPSIDTGAPVKFFIFVAILYILLSFFAQCMGKKSASADGEQGGCCAAGWCSYYAVKPWALGELIALAILLFSLFSLLAPAQTLIDSLLGMIDLIVAIITSTNAQITSMLGDVLTNVPQDVIDQIQSQRSNLELLPFVFLLPGLLPAIFIFFSGCCPLLPMRKGKFCMTKCMIFFVTILCIVGVVFYSILSLIVQLYADFDQLVAQFPSAASSDPRTAISSVTGTCGTIGPMITQMVVDNRAALDQATAAGVAIPDCNGQPCSELMDDLGQISGWLNTGCGLIDDMLAAIPGLYGPANFCLISLLFAIFTSETLCCAAGCCCSAKTNKPKDNGPKMVAEQEMTSQAV